MIRPLASLRWRQLRWVALVAVVPVLWACNSRKLARPEGDPSQVVKNRFQQSVNRDLDLLFLIDDSSSMAPLQQKMRDRLPDFMEVLKNIPGGLPNLHVAVVSSSLGAGTYGNVPGCMPMTGGNLDGNFQHSAGCTMLNSGERFISSIANPAMPGARIENFTGDISAVFQCIANLGDRGCGFEHQFEATRLALQKAAAGIGDNANFLRPSAYLAVVMLTNEDDCSVGVNSTLFDPAQQSVRDMNGGLQSYRCNEFGHLCDGPAPSPPHDPPGAPATLMNCRSKEDGTLTKVSEFTDFLKSLKPGHPEQVLVAAIAGPVTPYTVEGRSFQLANGSTEIQPAVQHSCTSGTGEYADPGVRIKQWLDGFGANAVLESICANDFRGAMVNIARVIQKALGAQCVMGTIKDNMNGDPDCDVTEQGTDAAGNATVNPIPFCVAGRTNAPCWEFQTNAMQCPGNNNRVLAVCYDANCTEGAKPSTKTDALVACSVTP